MSMKSVLSIRPTGWNTTSVGQVVLACMVFILVFSLGFLMLHAPRRPNSSNLMEARGGSDIRTGTIVLAPTMTETSCRKMQFNNETGAFRDQGRVSCDTDESDLRGGRAGHMDVIRESFRNR
jgi:hypothetical protein